MKTQRLKRGTVAVWVLQSKNCEYLISVETGEVLGSITYHDGKWNGFWLASLARHAVQTDYEMKELFGG